MCVHACVRMCASKMLPYMYNRLTIGRVLSHVTVNTRSVRSLVHFRSGRALRLWTDGVRDEVQSPVAMATALCAGGGNAGDRQLHSHSRASAQVRGERRGEI